MLQYNCDCFEIISFSQGLAKIMEFKWFPTPTCELERELWPWIGMRSWSWYES